MFYGCVCCAQFCHFVNKEEHLLCLNQRSSFDQGNGVYWANNVPPLRQRSCPRRLIWFYIFRAWVTLWLWLTFYGCIKDTGQQERQKMGLLTNAVKHFKHCRWDKKPILKKGAFWKTHNISWRKYFRSLSCDILLFAEARFTYQTIIRRLQNLILDTFTYSVLTYWSFMSWHCL